MKSPKARLRGAAFLTAMFVGLAGVALTAEAQACSSSWSKSGYKSYSQIKREVKSRLGAARIVRVELCGSGSSAYFKVIALSKKDGRSTREELRISAR